MRRNDVVIKSIAGAVLSSVTMANNFRLLRAWSGELNSSMADVKSSVACVAGASVSVAVNLTKLGSVLDGPPPSIV